jgi:hypothetical protein
MSFRQANSSCQSCCSTSKSLRTCSRACTGVRTGFLPLKNLLTRMVIFKLTVCESTYESELSLTLVLDTWFRVLVKVVSRNTSSYTWHEMTFCSYWSPQRCVVLCIGVGIAFQHLLQQVVSRMWPGLPPSEPFSLHVPLIQTVIELQDTSVWSIRDVVRNIEKAGVT